jgi:hypothetical protein
MEPQFYIKPRNCGQSLGFFRIAAVGCFAGAITGRHDAAPQIDRRQGS